MSAVTAVERPPLFDSRDLARLSALPRRLTALGYGDAFTIFGQLNLRTDLWAEDSDLLPDDLRDAFALFLLGREVPLERAAQALGGDMVESLLRLTVLRPAGAAVRTGDLVLVPAFGYLLLAERPGVRPVSYFGDDSAALAAHLMPSTGDRCLDLCSGPGIQAMVVSGRADSVVAIEIDPTAAAHAELNMVMNGLQDRVQVRIGDLYQPVAGERFDFISANPPLLPFVPELPYPFVGHGGADGLDVVRRILHGLADALEPGGICQLLGTCLGTWEAPLCLAELDAFARDGGWRLRMTLPTALALVPGAVMFEGLAATCAMASGLATDGVRDALQAHLQEMEASHLYLYFLTVSRDHEHPGLAATRHYERRVGFWFVNS